MMVLELCLGDVPLRNHDRTFDPFVKNILATRWNCTIRFRIAGVESSDTPQHDQVESWSRGVVESWSMPASEVPTSAKRMQIGDYRACIATAVLQTYSEGTMSNVFSQEGESS